MNKERKSRNIWKFALWISGMVILLGFTIMWYMVVKFDTDEQTTVPEDVNPSVYFAGYEKNEIVDSWETGIWTSGKDSSPTVYTGTTCGCSIVNDNRFSIRDWTLRIEIVQECYLNGFWCGQIEVHQFRDGDELVNVLDNRNLELDGLNIDKNVYSGTPLIRLVPGDYLIYLPSAEQQEDVAEAGEKVGIGFIFYHLERMDLSNWTLIYTNDLKITDLPIFIVLCALVLLWIIALIFYLSLEAMTKRMKSQMTSKIRTLSIMAEVYIEAYIIDIERNTARLVKGEEDNLILDLPGRDVQKTLIEKAKLRCQDYYVEKVIEFLDLSTVRKRMENTSILSFELEDKTNGWCIIRLIKAGEEPDDGLIVLTLQDINEEKKKLRAIEDRMSMAEYKQNVSGSFLQTVSYALNDISAKVSEAGREIRDNSEQEEMKALADRIVLNTRHMNLIQNTMIDLYHIEKKRVMLNMHPYNIHEMVDEVYRILKPFSENRPYEFIMDVDKNICPMLIGDSDRIEQILVIILFSSLLMTQSGFVKFSLFGKQHENEEELIFTVRDTGAGFSKEQLNEIHEFINGSSIETFDNASLVYLKIINGILTYMDSELNIVSVVDEGTDFFFTLRQGIAE